MVPVESMMTIASGRESRTLLTSSDVSMGRTGDRRLPEDCIARSPAQHMLIALAPRGKFSSRQQFGEQLDLLLLPGEHRGDLLGAQGVHLLVQREDGRPAH